METRLRRACLPYLLGLFLVGPVQNANALDRVVHHDIRVSLETTSSTIKAADTITLDMEGRDMEIRLALRPDVHILSVAVNGVGQSYRFEKGTLRIHPKDPGPVGKGSIAVKYEARFRDAMPTRAEYHESRNFGAVGIITEDKFILMDGAGWYPDIPDTYSTYRLEIEVPKAMEVVTAGRLLERKQVGEKAVFVWKIDHPVRGLSLSGGLYQVKTGQVGNVPTYFYHFPQTERFSGPYLAALSRYIPMYEKLFGPYPFSKFAVVENFLPTGYGFPSYTLLGSDVIRLPFIVDTSLGHEVAHSWWGNGVFVDYAKGNWSEGLTTYVADYLYKEQSSPEEAKVYRMGILRKYSNLVAPNEDFPLSRFIGGHNAASRAVGYGKSAMIFHMARRLAGEERFWRGLGEVYRTRLFQEATWSDFATALSADSREDFQAFFRQWVNRPGAPTLRLEDLRLTRVGGRWRVTGLLLQEEPVFELLVPMKLEVAGGTMETEIRAIGSTTPFAWETHFEPKQLLVDPDAHLFRRLDSREIPPDVNSIKGSDDLVAIVADDSFETYGDAARILLSGLGHRELPLLNERQIEPAQLKGKDLLLFGLPRSRNLMPVLPDVLSLDRDRFILDGGVFSRAAEGAFFTLKSGIDADKKVGLMLAFSRDAAVALAGKVPHYGSYSALVVQEGKVTMKKTWSAEDSPLIHRFSNKE